MCRLFHFILLISRCCTIGPVNRHWKLRERIQEEEVLVVLIERRRLTEETEELEARREVGDRPLPPVPSEVDGSGEEVEQKDAQQEEEDLIDIAAEEREANAYASEEAGIL